MPDDGGDARNITDIRFEQLNDGYKEFVIDWYSIEDGGNGGASDANGKIILDFDTETIVLDYLIEDRVIWSKSGIDNSEYIGNTFNISEKIIKLNNCRYNWNGELMLLNK